MAITGRDDCTKTIYTDGTVTGELIIEGEESAAISWLMDVLNEILVIRHFRDESGVGWLRVTVPFSQALSTYRVSPTGRVWRELLDGALGPELRGQSYDLRPYSPR